MVMGCTDDAKGLSYWYADTDGDGYGNVHQTVAAEEQPVGYVLNYTDCDDSDASVYPGAGENFDDDIDHDCDGCPYRVCCLKEDYATYTGDITITEEDDLEKLMLANKYYTTIDGNFKIRDTDFTDLLDMDELSCLETVTGNLTIQLNDYLCDAEAFADGLVEIGGIIVTSPNGENVDCTD